MSQLPTNIRLEFENKILILQLYEIIKEEKYIENTLEQLKSFLSDTFLQSLPIDVLNEQIFDTVCVYAHKAITEVIKNIGENLENQKNLGIQEDIKQFNILVDLLKCWNLCINQVSTLGKVYIIDIEDFLLNLFEIVIETLSICKTWGRNYKDQSDLVKNYLILTFRQCIDTLNALYSFLDSAISFDTNQENEMEILIKIIDNTGKLATLVIDTDFKTLMDMWKNFGKLSTNYSQELISISPTMITYHFKGLAQSVVSVLSYISQKSSSNERPIFSCRVLMKILEKLCEVFYGWISNDVMNEIIIMLTNLYKYTEENLEIVGYKSEFIKFVSSNFTVVIEPFLDVVIKNENFKMSFFNYGKTVNDNLIGYHLLLLKIVKNISTLPSEKQSEWYNEEESILDTCFQNIDRLINEICVGKLKIQISGNVAQGSYATNIYEATCLSIFSLACQIPSSDFSQLIMLLLRYLLSGKFFSSLLSSDVWCFICRLGSSDMCYSHFKYLIKIYGMLRERKNNLNVVMLFNLIGRQYNFLSETHKLDFINNLIEISDPDGWSPIVDSMSAQEKTCLQAKINISTLTDQISTHLRNLETQPSLNNFSLLIKHLKIIETSNVPQEEQLINIFAEIWNKIINILSDCEGAVLNILEELAIALLRATCPQAKEIQHITSILDSIVMMYRYASTGLRLEFCRSFYKLAEHLSDSHNCVAVDLLYSMLSDDNQFLQQQAFESFEYLTVVCQSEDILTGVALAVRNGRADLSKALSAYIGGEISHDIDLDNFFINLCSYAMESANHVCETKIDIKWEKIPKLEEPYTEPWSNSEDVENQANKVCMEMETILKFRRCLKKDTCDRLRQVCQKFLDQSD